MSSGVVGSLRVYPIKGGQGTDVAAFDVTARGPRHDRSFLVVGPDGKGLTQREIPRLALIRPDLESIEQGKLKLSTPDGDEIVVPVVPEGRQLDITVHRWPGSGVDQGDDVADWVSAFLGKPFRLVGFPGDQRRPTLIGDGEVGFADAYPILVTSTSSLDDLNGRMAEPLPMERFRPNVVVDGWVSPWTEDDVVTMRVGDVVLDLVKPCDRCVVTTIDQQTAEKGHEPLFALAKFRRQAHGLIFGQNAVPRSLGTVRVGTPVEVLARR